MSNLTKLDTALELRDAYIDAGSRMLIWAQRLVAAIDCNPKIIDELIDLGIDHVVIRRCEKLGRGQIHLKLLYATSAGARRLLNAPLSEQTAAIERGIEVLDEDETSTRHIFVDDMTPEQVRQVFSRNGIIRSITAQRSMIRERKAKVTPANGKVDYHIHKDHVVTTVPGKWSRKLILQWLTEMG